ncbi:MAG: ABC transporter permease [Defluviitaleaceae bacterium]|nr:ABC transporter permease [Defluviitaleaceae bacterium]
MLQFTLRRFLIMIPQLIVLSFVVFLIALAMPGDALTGTLDPNLTVEMLEIQRELLGLNNPWYVRYWDWIVGIVTRFDFGRSFTWQMPVTAIIGERLGNTLRLSTLTLVIMYAIAIPLGIISGRHHDTWKDKIITAYTYLGFGMPTMVAGLLLLFSFGFNLGWFPTGLSVAPGMSPDMGLPYHLSRLHHLILPALSVALITTVGTVQYLRGEIIDLEQREFILTVRAKGADENRVYNKHIFRNALLPIAAFLGFQIAFLIGGSVLVETVFSFPGIGGLFIGSITGRDFSVMMSLVLLFGAATIVGSFLSDVIMMMVDPRIEIE